MRARMRCWEWLIRRATRCSKASTLCKVSTANDAGRAMTPTAHAHGVHAIKSTILHVSAVGGRADKRARRHTLSLFGSSLEIAGATQELSLD